MPKRTDISKILIIGSGPVVIGQGSEYDGAAAAACKTLREMGYETIVVNSNPAAVSTDGSFADRVYIEPLTVDSIRKIIEKEKPDALVAAYGGQSALYLASELDREGVLADNGVKVLGVDGRGVGQFGDASLFNEIAESGGIPIPRSGVADSFESGMQMMRELGLPIVIRPAYTPGGAASNVAYNAEEFVQMLAFAINMSPSNQVLLEKPVLGWKQIEMIVLRDSSGDAEVVTGIESIDPAGVHPGNSPAVVPIQTLSREVIGELEVVCRDAASGFDVTGVAEVRCAVSPSSVVVLGVQPCAGRGTALASTATGFSVATASAKLIAGLSLEEAGVRADSYGIPAGRIAVKMPRFDFEKFPGTDETLGTSMAAVGESVAIADSFTEALQKSIRSLDAGRAGLGSDGCDPEADMRTNAAVITERMIRPNADRLFWVRYAIEQKMSAEEISNLSGINRWFVEQIGRLVEFEKKLEGKSLVGVSSEVLAEAKRLGYADAQLAALLETTEEQVSTRRNVLGIKSESAAVDCSCYLTYNPSETPCPAGDGRKVLLLAGGPSRIGQGSEFDFSVFEAAVALADDGILPVIVNCDPNAASVSAATPGKVYIAPMTREDVMDVIDREKPEAVIAGFGGHVALSLGRALSEAGVTVLGTPVKSVDRIMNRKSFIDMLRKLELRQMVNETASSVSEALQKADKLGYPVLVRPGRVHYGRDRMIVYDAEDLSAAAESALASSLDGTAIMYKFLEDASEVTADAVGDGESAIVCGVMEHIEQAGVHAGDSACSLPPHNLSDEAVAEVKRQTRALALELGIKGLLSVRFAVKDSQVYVLAINPRASRTVPFVSKATGVSWAGIAARVAMGKSLRDQGLSEDLSPKPVSVKEAVFPFVRFPGADVVLGPDMKSTGQVMGINAQFGSAYIKAQIAADQNLPKSGTVFLSLADRDKVNLIEIGRRLKALGFDIVATRGTAGVLEAAGVEARAISKIGEGRPDAIDLIKNGEIDLIINTRSGKKPRAHEITIRGAVVARAIPIITTIAGAKATLFGMETVLSHGESVKSLQDHLA